MKKIFKYTLPAGGWGTLSLPPGSRLLSAREQFGAVVLYAEVDPAAAASHNLRVHVVLTGDVAPEGAEFIDTIMMAGGEYVVHVYVEWV